MSTESTGQTSRHALEERLEHVEDLLAAGVPSGAVAKRVAARFQISRRQARRYVQQVFQRREKERVADAPYRRENLLRKLESAYAKCMSEKKYGPAIQALVVEARLSGAFNHTADREALLARVGLPPEDPGEMLVYARRVLMASLHETLASPHLDIEKRQRIISDIAFKIAATQSRTEIEADVLRFEALLAARRLLPPAAEIVDAKAAGWSEAPGGRGSPRGPRPLPGSGAPPGEGEDGGDDPPSGGPLGSA